MFSNFEADFKASDRCLHIYADKCFHPSKEDPFSKWSTKHPKFASCFDAKPPQPKIPEKDVHYHYYYNNCACSKPPVVPAPPKPAPPPPKPAPPTCFRIFPCYKVIEKYKIVDHEWCPEIKEYKSDKIFQVHGYFPGVAQKPEKEKIMVDIIDLNTIVIHGEAKYHSHCGSFKPISHSCTCTLVVPMPFMVHFKLPEKLDFSNIKVNFEAEVLVVSIAKK
ncbi:hypothetical protein BB561_002764 [Smittium simulii]|uniref:SHSP domain-containing protein n=1 Tax=Smittium simulii TaxID=133385 RepID=A0A2T9YP75_9FUNG|nr:hypothetical protein BB561_002764 [Smittium simulii]